jgi:hypothetical protein
MNFLIGLISALIEWFLAKLGTIFSRDIKQYQNDQSAIVQAQKDKNEIQNAETDEDREIAITRSIDDTFH